MFLNFFEKLRQKPTCSDESRDPNPYMMNFFILNKLEQSKKNVKKKTVSNSGQR